MGAVQIVEFIERLLSLGLSISEIAKRLCDEHAGYQIPDMKTFDAETRELEKRSLTRTVTLTRKEQSDEGTFGELKTPGFSCVTGELPWRDNEPNKSCIPAGEYECFPYSSQKYPAAYEVSKVPGRSAILIHQGNLCGDVDKGFQSNVQGCILLGTATGNLSGQKAVLNSKDALTSFVKFMNNQPFKLVIKEDW